MSEAVEVAAALGAAFPTDDAVAAMRDEDFAARFAPVRELAWPDFEVAMVGASPTVRIEAKGLDGLLDAWRDWLSPFESHRTEIEELRDGGDRAVIFIRQFARPRGTSAEVENSGAVVIWTREAKLSRVEFHIDRAAALEAAGLEG
jgi:ketosteroid isomerase-like protein